MPSSFSLPEQAAIIGAAKPAADAAGRAGRFISVKNCHKVFIVAYYDQADAAVIPLTIQQASDVAGTGAKAITKNVKIWSALDLATSQELVRRADALDYSTDAALKEKLVVIELDPSTLDIANGFDCIRASTGASNVANITSLMYFGTPLRYAGDKPPAVTAD